MPRRVRIVLLVLTLLAVAACQPAPSTDSDNANVNGTSNRWGWFEAGLEWRGDFADPHVLYSGRTYYAYAKPASGRYLPVLTSTDLTHWRIHHRWTDQRAPWAGGPDPRTDPRIPAEIRSAPLSAGDTWNLNDALVSTAGWGMHHDQGPWIKKDYWAPGVIQIGSTWYAYSAVKTSPHSDDPHGIGRFCITVASAPSPLGPFRDVSGGGPIVCDADPAGSIDPYPYVDPATGEHFLLWKAAGRVSAPGVRGYPSALKAQRIGADGRPVPGSPVVTMLTTNEGSWEGMTIENPAMATWGGQTYLFYSGNDWRATAGGTSNYATGYAVCPQGPRAGCGRIQGDPLLRSGLPRQGPGGASAFVGGDGQLYLAYAYYWHGENRPDRFNAHPRRLGIVRLARDGAGRFTVAQQIL